MGLRVSSLFGFFGGLFGGNKTKRFNLGSFSGTSSLYFYNYRAGGKYDLFRGGTLVASTNATADSVSNFTDEQKTFLSSNSNASNWFFFNNDGSFDLEN